MPTRHPKAPCLECSSYFHSHILTSFRSQPSLLLREAFSDPLPTFSMLCFILPQTTHYSWHSMFILCSRVHMSSFLVRLEDPRRQGTFSSFPLWGPQSIDLFRSVLFHAHIAAKTPADSAVSTSSLVVPSYFCFCSTLSLEARWPHFIIASVCPMPSFSQQPCYI